MSQTFYVLERLDPPFRSIAERSMLVAQKGRHVSTGLQKIVLILGGECRHNFENEPPETLSTGDVLVVPCRTRQFYQPPISQDSAWLHNIVLTFSPECLPIRIANPELRKQAGTEARSPQEFVSKYFPRNTHLKNILNAAALEMVAQIRHEAELRPIGSQWRISALCAQLIVQLARNLETSEPLTSSSEARRGVFLVSSAKEYLLQHLSEEVRLQDVADQLQVSSGHLARTFKQITGQSLFTYFRQLRLEQAKLKLLDTQHTVTTIAEECGFSSTTLFCRNFKKYTRLTPLAYRNEFGARAEL